VCTLLSLTLWEREGARAGGVGRVRVKWLPPAT
jgi:hypothetical protein